MRKQLKKYLPGHQVIHNSRWLAPFGDTLLHPRLWHLNRHSAAGAVAVGMFCGLVPGPFQMIAAAICAVLFRVNLPLALFTTLYTNPLTIVPLYIVAYTLGKFALGHDGEFVMPPDYGPEGFLSWMASLMAWMSNLGKPLVVGLILLGSLLALTGYAVTRALWRLYLVRAWKQRRRGGTA